MDRKKIICTFENYVSNYNLNDPNIYLKYKHTGKQGLSHPQLAFFICSCRTE